MIVNVLQEFENCFALAVYMRWSTRCLLPFKKNDFMHYSVTLLWVIPQIWHAFLLKERKKNPFHFALRHCFFQFLRARDETLIHPSLPPSLSFLTASFWGETEKSGVTEGANVRGNWRWQIIVGKWRSRREDVAVEDEVAQCFSDGPKHHQLPPHLLFSFVFFSPFCSHLFIPLILFAPMNDLCSCQRYYVCFI